MLCYNEASNSDLFENSKCNLLNGEKNLHMFSKYYRFKKKSIPEAIFYIIATAKMILYAFFSKDNPYDFNNNSIMMFPDVCLPEF